ncbi:MAG: NIPSNAP family protein [Candidatus Dormibacteria bacterium]
MELRQYTLYGGRRDELITVFEGEFINTQDEVGAHVIGTFRDLDDPDRFVWLRGFTDMPARAKALNDFYTGPAWKMHNRAANVTMLDSSNVLLLHPSAPLGGFLLRPPSRPVGEILAFIHYVDEALIAPFAVFFADHIARRAKAAGAELLASFASETSPNTFPQLPVREKDRVFVWFARLAAGGEANFRRDWRTQTGWRDSSSEALLPALMRKPEMLRLTPTERSPLR